MNFTTQAAEDILGKIERDPAFLREFVVSARILGNEDSHNA